jgi:hypothetical protein
MQNGVGVCRGGPGQHADRLCRRQDDEVDLALSIPADQAWLWTPAWQARIAEAEADREQGNSTVYRSEEEFLASARNCGWTSS